MQVTVTLFFQMGNFFIAWFLLHYFYFKPAVSVLEEEQRYEDECLKRKGALGLVVKEKEQDMLARWLKLKHFVAQHIFEKSMSDSCERIHAFHSKEEHAPVVDGKDIQAQIDRMKEAVMAEVLRVNL